MPQPVIVVGAGVGGLAAALELAASGVEVVVLERAATAGGKLRQVSAGGAAMDAGPTVFTMRWVFDALFARAGARLDEHLRLSRLAVIARHAWSEDERLDLYADRERSADAIGTFAGSASRRGFLDFCERARGIFETLDAPFLRGSRPNPLSLTARVGARGLPGLLRIAPFQTLWQELGRYFPDPRLRQLFGRYATYCGSSPFLAPATLMLVAHVEQDGVWSVEGGMHEVARALRALAEARGAHVRCDADVAEIVVRDGRAAGVRLASGETLQAAAVVFNGDTAALGAGLLGGAVRNAAPATPPSRRSLSALTWNLSVATRGFPLARHSVFFSPDYRREFDDVVGAGRLPSDPSVYVCAQDRRDGAPDPVGPERLLLIVNAPARGDSRPFTPEELERCETRTFAQMARCGLHLEPGPAPVRTTPTDFDRLFPATGGALYGPASHGWQASFSRAGARSRLPGLYLAGGSVHPGPGVPMAALSGHQAATSVLADLPRTTTTARPPSTPTSRTAATSGGTSMR